MAADVDTWVAAGLLEPGDDGRRDLLAWLDGLGVPLEEMRRAHAAGRLFALAGDREITAPGRRRTADEAAAEMGLDVTLLRRAWLSLGLPDPVGPVLGDDDLTALRTVADVAALVGEQTALTLARVLGAGLARLADAESSALRGVVGIDLGVTGNELTTARSWQAVAGVVPRIGGLLDAAHRHHVEAARRHWEQVVVDGTVRSGVGFADLSGFTALTERASLPELAALLSAFDATASEVVHARGGRVVKFLGDAVMFVATDPDALAGVALDLVHHPRARSAGLQLRAAIAAGELVAQEGDWYGPPVNLAARLVGVARPGQVLAAADPAHRLSAAFRTEPQAPVTLRGVSGPVTAWSVARAP